MNIDNMPAGREMDVLVAEKVMGWRRPDPGKGRSGTWVDKTGEFMAEAACGTEYGDDDGPCPGECGDECLRFRPSTDAKHAREVLRELKKRGVKLTVSDPEPDSICRAALRL